MKSTKRTPILSKGVIYIFKKSITKSITLGIVLFLLLILSDWIFKDEVDWVPTLFGSIMGALVYFAFEMKDRKNEQ